MPKEIELTSQEKFLIKKIAIVEAYMRVTDLHPVYDKDQHLKSSYYDAATIFVMMSDIRDAIATLDWNLQ